MTFLLFFMFWGSPDASDAVAIKLEIPEIQARPYHRPYVAVWLETADRKGVQTITLWYEGKDWLKDLRQWWRKLGRNSASLDGVSGATRKPGSYTLSWNGLDASGNPVSPGIYYLNIELAREQGGREFHRQKIELGSIEPQTYRIAGEREVGAIEINVISGGSIK